MVHESMFLTRTQFKTKKEREEFTHLPKDGRQEGGVNTLSVYCSGGRRTRSGNGASFERCTV